MDHNHYNDPKQVILSNPNAKKRCIILLDTIKRPIISSSNVKDLDPENNPLIKVTPELKRKCISARTLFLNPQSNKKGLTHEQLATKINMKPSDIKELESGKIDLKKAKAIALKMEKVLKIKLLGN